MDESRDGGGITVIETYGDGEDLVGDGGGGGGSKGDAEVGAGWVCRDERGSEEGGEHRGGWGERLPDGRLGVKGRHYPDCSSMISNWG